MASPILQSRSYHHGDLKQALLTEAEALLRVEGLQGLTLRAVSRAAGVTHAAPANHFGDLSGLLSELAASGYRRFAAALSAAVAAAGEEQRARALAMGRAYVAFARENPQLFLLMFRGERLDAMRPALRDAIAAAREVLRSALSGRPDAPPASPLQRAAEGIALWSLVHGYAMLMLDGRLKGTLGALPGPPDELAFAEAVLGAVRLA
ncbi:TetR/AcrR family transcriptional regulator [Roseomonas populi]|uniref:WHG domain-containing protein n=1 Tax=Roseomonas populi TaxID=3121582 RepID=A0ABT1X3D8_9PROT|nr:TetR-like C-terminal domain-containing protein [Roseomonas pecuniae]MCR0981484.1 WHG domain-containing protein [Roseomonas pecuniae]